MRLPVILRGHWFFVLCFSNSHDIFKLKILGCLRTDLHKMIRIPCWYDGLRKTTITAHCTPSTSADFPFNLRATSTVRQATQFFWNNTLRKTILLSHCSFLMDDGMQLWDLRTEDQFRIHQNQWKIGLTQPKVLLESRKPLYPGLFSRKNQQQNVPEKILDIGPFCFCLCLLGNNLRSWICEIPHEFRSRTALQIFKETGSACFNILEWCSLRIGNKLFCQEFRVSISLCRIQCDWICANALHAEQ